MVLSSPLAGAFDYEENKILDAVFGSSHSSLHPTNWYLGLSSTKPADDGTNITEPSTGAYARIAITNDTTNWPAAASGLKANGVAYAFPAPTADWLAGAALQYWVLWDASTAGNPRYWSRLRNPHIVLNGDQAPEVPIGAVVILSD